MLSLVPVDLIMDGVLFSVQDYMNEVDGRVYFKAHRFGLMPYSGDDHFVTDNQMHEDRLTGDGGWARSWRHWSGQGSDGLSAVDTRVNSPFVLCA